jgi:hypothetical protein
MRQNLWDNCIKKGFSRCSLKKPRLGREQISASCRAHFALSNYMCLLSGSFLFSDNIFAYFSVACYRQSPTESFENFLVHRYSNETFHEESEYAIGFEI